MLADFADRVDGPVADVGCGTGRLTAYLDGLGIDVVGIDLSPGMIAVARRAYPALRFEVGSMTALDLPDGGVAGVLAWYSIIHTPPDGPAGGRRRAPSRPRARAGTCCWASRRAPTSTGR